MKEYLNRKEFTKPLFIFLISLIALTFFMLGMLNVARLRIYSATVYGNSMANTLHDGSEILLINAKVRELKRGDIVSVDVNDAELRNINYLKRVIALPNEKVEITGQEVYVNGKLLEEPYAYYSTSSDESFTFNLKEDQYFIMGDNRCNSLDSRYIGPVNYDDILSIVWKYK